MSFFKILGGIAAGVGCVVAAPVFGAVGAVTAVGAAVGAGVGALAGGIAARVESDEKEVIKTNAHKEGVFAGENAIKVKFSEKLNTVKKRDELLLAMTAMGIAMANANGVIEEEELLEIQTFTGVIENNVVFPQELKDAVSKIIQEKPNFRTAIQYAKQIDKESYELITQLLETVAYADGTLDLEEKAILDKWEGFMELNI
ncbi:MAG: TerB family tellurite resistance protein [Fusobacteriaceae bacterium]